MTVAEILQQVHDLVLSPAEALPLIQAQIDAATDRNLFAAHALQGRLAAGFRPPTKDALVLEAFEWADRMVAGARGELAAAAKPVQVKL